MPGSKGCDMKIVMHFAASTTDNNLVQEFQKHLSNA